jgi:hypothetical protein
LSNRTISIRSSTVEREAVIAIKAYRSSAVWIELSTVENQDDTKLHGSSNLRKVRLQGCSSVKTTGVIHNCSITPSCNANKSVTKIRATYETGAYDGFRLATSNGIDPMGELVSVFDISCHQAALFKINTIRKATAG